MTLREHPQVPGRQHAQKPILALFFEVGSDCFVKQTPREDGAASLFRRFLASYTRAYPCSGWLRAKELHNHREKTGVRKIPKKVTPIIPANTAVPSA